MTVQRPLPVHDAQAEITRDLIRKARKLLQQPLPDTFLGRKTQDEPAKESGRASPRDKRGCHQQK